MLQSVVQPLVRRVTDKGSKTLIQRAIASLRARGSNAHLWLPGVGTLNGLTTGNYLESSGNTLATVDNPTGLVLDALGTVGVELAAVMNGDAGWTNTGGGVYSFVQPGTGGRNLYNNTTAVSSVGKIYKIVCDVVGVGFVAKYGLQTKTLTVGHNDFIIVAPGVNTFEINATSVTTGSVSAISVREVTGIHLTQGTTANKPLLRRGLVNLLMYSGDFTTVYWSLVAGATRSTVVGAGPDGSAAIRMQTAAIADGLRQYQTTVAAGYTGAVLIKSNNGSTQTLNLRYFNNTEQLSTPITVTTEWQVLAAPVTATAGGNFQFDIQSSVTTPVVDVLISRALLTPGTYTAAQILAAGGIPVTTTAAGSNPDAGKYSWAFDGSNDSLALGSVPFQMGDDHCVIAGGSVNTTATVKTLFAQRSTASMTPIVASLVIDSANKPACGWRNDANTLVVLTSDTAVSGSFVVANRKVGDDKSLFVNGVLKGNSSTALGGPTTITSAAIGVAPQGTPDSYMNGSTGPVLAIKGTVSDSDLLMYERLIAALTPNGPVF